MKINKLTLTLFSLMFSWSSSVYSLTADDFLPPAQAQNDAEKAAALEIKEPNSIKEETGLDGVKAVSAANIQDAVNSASQKIQLNGGIGAQQIKFPSGFGWVASGVSTYNVMPNSSATLTQQRLAYQKAFLSAKKNLAEALYGLSTEAKETLLSELDLVENETETLSNSKESHSEHISEAVNGMLRGYVVYNLEDKQDEKNKIGTVTVTIVTTPKTMGMTTQVNTDSLTADNINDGLNHVLSEISTGLVAPVGGKTISIPSTGEMAFVGFGSAIIPDNPNAATKAKLSLNAQKMSVMRARSALCGIILGDSVSAKSQLDSSTLELSNQFEQLSKEDPFLSLDKQNQMVQKFEEQKNLFVSRTFSSEEISSTRKGVLPPGVMVKTFVDESNTVAQSVAIYIPSMSDSAAKAGKTMKENEIVKDQKSQSKNTDNLALPKAGPTGQVTKDEDL